MNHSNTTGSQIQAVVFDLGGVLIGVDNSRAIERWASATGLPVDRVAEVYWSDTLYQQMECGELTIQEYHRRTVDQLGKAMGFDDFLAGWNSVLGPPLPGVEQLIDGLRRSVRLACLTNTNASHAEVWRPQSAAVLDHFERVFCSHEMGLRKPDPRIFECVLDELSLPAEAVVFVDDRVENVQAAESIGMVGLQAEGPDQTITGLRKLGFSL